jgi:hypothetical protein
VSGTDAFRFHALMLRLIRNAPPRRRSSDVASSVKLARALGVIRAG